MVLIFIAHLEFLYTCVICLTLVYFDLDTEDKNENILSQVKILVLISLRDCLVKNLLGDLGPKRLRKMGYV